MFINKFSSNNCGIKLEKDELVIASLEKLVKENSVGFAKIEIIGAVKNTTLGYVEGISGKYQWKSFSEQKELLSGLGTIAWDKDKNVPLIHCHVSLGNEDFSVIGGHLKEAQVAVVCEVILTILSEKKVYRKLDKNVNLKLWDFI